MRRLVLPIETVVDALLQFDRDRAGTLSWGVVLDATIESQPTPGLQLVLKSRRSGAVESRFFALPAIAAAIINYCRQSRIPLPRNGDKTLEIVPEGFAFCIRTTLNVPRWHDAFHNRAASTITRADAPGGSMPQQEAAGAASGLDTESGMAPEKNAAHG